jgi:hypothetical protein
MRGKNDDGIKKIIINFLTIFINNIRNFFKCHRGMCVKKNLIVVNDILYVVCERLKHPKNKLLFQKTSLSCV